MSDIAVSRKQRVFVVKETTVGTLKFPEAKSFIRPAGDAVLNQTPDYSDSLEKQDTLDVLDQFQNAMPPGDWTIPMYIRPSGTLGHKPQGSPLFETLQGSVNPATYCTVSAAFATAADKIKWNGPRGGEFPEKGVIIVDSEYIHYNKCTNTRDRTNASVATGSFASLERGYDGTVDVNHGVNDVVTLKSVYYKQAPETPSCSIWIESDHFVQGLSGAVAQQCALSLANEGGVVANFTGGGMQMVWAGKDAMQKKGAVALVTIKVEDADRFSEGIRIYNYTQDDHACAGTDGYRVAAVSSALNLLTLATVHDAVWATGDVIRGYLPTGTLATGDALEGKDITVKFDAVSASFRNTDLTIAAPKEYVMDEIGTTYPEKYLENIREITATLNLYFRDEDAKYFAEGYEGNEVAINLSFGDTDGHRMFLYIKKAKLSVPTISFESPAVPITIPMKALGTVGEDSLEIRFE